MHAVSELGAQYFEAGTQGEDRCSRALKGTTGVQWKYTKVTQLKSHRMKTLCLQDANRSGPYRFGRAKCLTICYISLLRLHSIILKEQNEHTNRFFPHVLGQQ